MEWNGLNTRDRVAATFLILTLALCPAEVRAAGNFEPLTGATQLSAGRSHACVVTARGGVKCWGLNADGQLGDGTQENAYVPVSVVGLTDIVSVSAGGSHTCAVNTAGGVKCWGNNFLSQLGDGSSAFQRDTPVDVVGLDSGVMMVSAGDNHTCALDVDGEIRCWGFNGDGQLGNGNRDTANTPQLTSTNPLNMAITTGDSNSCLLTGSGTVSCWGVYDRECNLFGCAFGSFSRPTRVDGLADIVGISSGEYFNCAVTDAGAVKCWGDNFEGQLNNSGEDNPDPFELFDIPGLAANVAQVSAGFDHGCARMNNGAVRCWGDNTFSRLGDGTSEYRLPAVPATGLSNATQIETGRNFSCALTTGGGVQCWGSNGTGQLGNNDPWFRLTPTAVPGLQSGITSIAVGDRHSCALSQTGTLRCWGANDDGQLGTGDFQRATIPANVTGLAGSVASIGAGRAHTCAVTTAGAAQCWGDNERGQLGDGSMTTRPGPTAVQGLSSGVAQIDGGDAHTCATTTSGAARCWGWNIDSQLGDASLMNQPAPVAVANRDSGVAEVEAGGVFSCALETAGTVSCWGSNSSGQLGNGTRDQAFAPEPVSIPFGSTAAGLGLGREHACLLDTAGDALCWGRNDSGQLGTTIGSGTTPEQVIGLRNAVRISAGSEHTCAATNAGTAFCWGDNDAGQLGTGSRDQETFPAELTELPAGVTRLAAGDRHTCALTGAGAVFCWGSNSSDQLGLDRINHQIPGAVLDNPSFFRSSFEAGEGR